MSRVFLYFVRDPGILEFVKSTETTLDGNRERVGSSFSRRERARSNLLLGTLQFFLRKDDREWFEVN